MSNDPSAGQGESHPPRLEQFRYDDAIVRKFAIATFVWGLVAMLAGVYIALELAFPKANFGLPWISFGRLRPLHTNAAIFAFAGNAIFTAVYYSTQRLCKARMWNDLLSNLHFWGWQAIIVAAALTLPFGYTQGKEYAELEWPIDIAIAVVWAGFFGVNFIMTLVKRRERHLYVALWFYIASLVTVAILHIFNSLSVFAGPLKSYPVYSGVQDAFVQWWYGHNAVAFFLTTPFLGLMYYFLPKVAQRPIFSYKLSILHFWSLVFIYIWAGPHHLHYTALPQWASTVGMLFSLMLWMPSWGGMINGLMTLRGAWHKVVADPILKYFVVAITFYGMSTFEGPLMSIKSVNALSHYTDWTIGHVHGGTLGWNGFLAFGMLYWLVPRLWQTRLWSIRLCAAHFWIGFIGILMYWLSMYVSGITQGLMWRAFDETGSLAYPEFIETVVRQMPMYWIRMAGGALYVVGVLICGVNFIMTIRSGPKKLEDPVYEAPALTRNSPRRNPYRSDLEQVIDLGKRTDELMELSWHRKYEGLPVRFTVAVIVAVSVASLFEAIPTWLVEANRPKAAWVKPYTPLEQYGRDIYVAEGCYNCHSQMIRPMRHETERYGPFSVADESVYDHPFQWGSKRNGPDLARVGGTRNHLWHWQHFENPSNITAGSIMPPYPWLLEDPADFDAIPARLRALAMVGVPYGADVLDNAVGLAEAQARTVAQELHDQGGPPAEETWDTQAVALIAYLQRLGIDYLNKDAAPAEEGGE
ncbi:MAG: cytochrome-c oxidase, cbb3-type subunit I [Phycisphaerales bacterium]